MAGRKTFFSFHYQRDIWKVNVVRNVGVIDFRAAAGWRDGSLWEASRRKSDRAIKKLIDQGLHGTSVTVVLIGHETAERAYVNYEIEESLFRGNGLLGVHIHDIADNRGDVHYRGEVPELLLDYDIPIYDWDRYQFGRWVEKAAVFAGKPCSKHQTRSCFLCKCLL
jgi:hypothetical protein